MAVADTQQPEEGSYAWFLAQGLDPYTGKPMEAGEKVRGPKRSSKKAEAKQPKAAPSKDQFVVNYHPPKIGQGASRLAGAVSINVDAIGPAFRNAAESAKRALGIGQKPKPSALAQGLRAAAQDPEIVGGNSTLSFTPTSGPAAIAASLRAFSEAMGGPLSERKAAVAAMLAGGMGAMGYAGTSEAADAPR